MCNECDIDSFTTVYAPTTAFKCCCDGAGYNRKMYIEKQILAGEVVNDGFEAFKMSLQENISNPRPILDDNDNKRRTMTETKSHHYYVVDERIKDNFKTEKSDVLEKIIHQIEGRISGMAVILCPVLYTKSLLLRQRLSMP